MSVVQPPEQGKTAHLSSLAQLDESYRYQLLVEAVLDYAIFLLDADGFVSSWNAGAQRFKGYEASEIIGQHFSRFYTEEDRVARVPQRALETASHEGRFEAEGWRVRKDGTRFWASVVIDPLRDAAGQLIGFAKVTRDITEKHRGQLELQATQLALHRSQRLEALGRVTGGLAHDFNNFITVISGAAELLRNPELAPEKRLKYINAIADTAQRATHLTQKMLAYASPASRAIPPRRGSVHRRHENHLPRHTRLCGLRPISAPRRTMPHLRRRQPVGKRLVESGGQCRRRDAPRRERANSSQLR